MLPAYESLDAVWIFKLILFWGSSLVPPGFAWIGWRRWRGEGPRWWRLCGVGVVAAVCGLFIQARFIEPQLITVRETQVGLGIPARVALIGDLHLGIYKGPQFLARVVERLNALEVDAVLIAGDVTGEPDRPLDELLAPLRQLRHPAFSVPGNHDEGLPGPPLAQALREALQGVGVQPAEGHQFDLGPFVLVGLGDHWAGRDQPGPAQQPTSPKPRIVLTHNPDSAMRLPRGWASLVLAGHTHGGQIRLPGLYRSAIPTQHPFDRGLHDFPPIPTYVTSGLGETGLPLRWMNPPVIDLLDLR